MEDISYQGRLSSKRKKRKILIVFLIVLASLLAVFSFSLRICIVNGNSMKNTYGSDDVLLMEKISPVMGHIKKGDVVLIYHPDNFEKRILLKRVIATELDQVEIKDGGVFVNGEILKEDYIAGDYTQTIVQEYNNIKVPEGHVYVLGDNRTPGGSLDSRAIGLVKLDSIKGKVVFKLFSQK
ncbi:MAG: signal peptidase I [Clostridia bacterium]|nr:signal peptidase I [Clostridia bacterium]